jgi:hypothetical protein
LRKKLFAGVDDLRDPQGLVFSAVPVAALIACVQPAPIGMHEAPSPRSPGAVGAATPDFKGDA